MRLFPRAARRRHVTTALVVAVASGALALPLAHADDLKDRQDKVKQGIRGAKSDLEDSSADLRQAKARLAAAQKQLVAAQAKLTDARAKVTAAEERDAELQRQLVKAQAELVQARTALRQGKWRVSKQRHDAEATMLAIYKQGDPELTGLANILDAQDPADMTRAMEARNVMVGKEKAAYDDLRATQVVLQVNADDVKKAADAVATKKKAAAAHVKVVQGLEDDAEKAATKVADLVTSRQSAAASAAWFRKRDLVHLKQLERSNEWLKKLLQRRAEAAMKKKARSGRTAGGFLSYPVWGAPVTSPFGYRIHPIYGYYSLHDGTDFGAACGTPLRAPANGTVVQEYFQTAYGNRLVIDHGIVAGKGLASILNHAIRYTVGVGDRVERGQVVGYVGTTGWSTGCHLHYTVLANGTPVNPMTYLR